MAKTEKEVNGLQMHTLRKAKYEALQRRNEINEDALYLTTDYNEQCEYGDLIGNIENQKDLICAIKASNIYASTDMNKDPRGYDIIKALKGFDRDKFNSFFNVTEGVIIPNSGIYDGRNILGAIVTKNNINTSSATSFEMSLKFMTSAMASGINEDLFTITNSTYRSHQNNSGYNLNLYSTNIPSWSSINVIEGTWLTYRLFVDYTQNTSVVTLSKDDEILSTATFNARRFNNKIYLCNYFDISEHGMRIDLGSTVIKLDNNVLFEDRRETTEDVYPEYNITIPYYATKSGVKIVDVQYKNLVDQLYEISGTGNYIILDETNEEFRLPIPDIYSQIERKSSFILRKWED